MEGRVSICSFYVPLNKEGPTRCQCQRHKGDDDTDLLGGASYVASGQDDVELEDELWP